MQKTENFYSVKSTCCESKTTSNSNHNRISRNNWRQRGFVFVSVMIILLLFMDFHVAHGFAIHDDRANSKWTSSVTDGQGSIIQKGLAGANAEEILDHKIVTKSISDSMNPETQSSDDASIERHLREIIGSKRDIKIQNTSDLHNDNHGSSHEAENIKNVPNVDFLRKVVVLQKPFHFHIPIISSKEHGKTSEEDDVRRKKKDITIANPNNHHGHVKSRSTDTSGRDHIKALTFDPAKTVPKTKRDIQLEGLKVITSETAEKVNREGLYPSLIPIRHDRQETIDLDHLLSQNPKLIPPDNRKRVSGKDKRNENMDYETHQHSLMGFPINDDDLVQDDVHFVPRKRNVQKVTFSQDIVDAILGHQDDLVTYRKRIREHAKGLGIKPEHVFQSVVYGAAPNKPGENMSTLSDIYQRRLKFHQLFLDDSAEVEKYHMSEVVDQDGRADRKSGPFNAYMKIHKRSKRGLKSWLKKLFRRGGGDTTTTTTTTTEEPVIITEDAPKRRKKHAKHGNKKRGNKEEKSVYEIEVDVNGDTQVDLLLPKALRRSTYLAKRDKIKNMEKEEEEFEEEYEKSEEQEPTERDHPSTEDEKDDEDGDEGSEEEDKEQESDSEEKKAKRKHRKKKRKTSEIYGKRPTRLHREKRSVGDNKNVGSKRERTRISSLSKDEIVLVLEMIFNLVEYQCTNIKKMLLDELLSITQLIIGMSSLYDYIPERRRGVDQLFDQMLECSSNAENFSKWAEYQERKRHEKKGIEGEEEEDMIGKYNMETESDLYDMPLRRTKRVRRGHGAEDHEEDAIELISIQNVTEHDVRNDVDEKLEEIEDYSSNNEDSFSGLKKLYVLVYQIISDACFNVDHQLLRESSMVFMEEMDKLKMNAEDKREIEKHVGHYDISMAYKLLSECYEAEML